MRSLFQIKAWAYIFPVLACILLCGVTLHLAESRLRQVQAREEQIEKVVHSLTNQVVARPAISSSEATDSEGEQAQTGSALTSRLARIIDCQVEGNLVRITYDPAQLFTGAEAVKVAALSGDAVTGDSYILDSTHDTFVASAPIRTQVACPSGPGGSTSSLPATVEELSVLMNAPGGDEWREQYCWLQFNAGYVVRIEQYEEAS